MLHYDRANKPYLTEHSGHCSCCDARFAADADLYMVPGDEYAARNDIRATFPVCAQCLTPDQRERAREIGLAITCPGCGHCMIPRTFASALARPAACGGYGEPSGLA